MFGMENSTVLIIGIAIVAAAAVAYVAYARKKGATTADQIRLKVADDADAFRDRVVRALKEYADAHPPTLKDHYFDADDFLMDVGRLPDAFPSAVTLNDAVKRNGSQPALKYITAENGNVNKAS